MTQKQQPLAAASHFAAALVNVSGIRMLRLGTTNLGIQPTQTVDAKTKELDTKDDMGC
jgi:hypothetical protein